ncbi:MAG: V-type ATP synthase subunit F [Spirochaetales bacterium]|nr:V-type ATP synthase subunit F [Spirochaetales bacterium]RKX82254.1 MAG: ATP synthase subunit F [Spirochaetota bacterium]
MKFYLITDNIDTQIGLRLVGVKGVTVHTKKEVLDALESLKARLKEREDIGILLITEKIAELIPDELNEMRLSKKLPLVTVIPDRHGSRRPKDFITRNVEEAIGVKIK